MKSAPRIVVIELASAQRIHSWREHCDGSSGLPRVGRPVVDDADRFVWQLSSSNHRAVARGYRAHPSEESVLAEIASVRARRDELAVRSIRLSQLPVYAWVASLGNETIVMSGRSYSTVRDMRDSVALARLSLATATVGPARREAAASRPPVAAGRAR